MSWLTIGASNTRILISYTLVNAFNFYNLKIY